MWCSRYLMGALGNRPRWACPNGALTGQLPNLKICKFLNLYVSDAPCRQPVAAVTMIRSRRQGASETTR